ncbi:MAG: hypothetical protein RQM90_14465 [Methanoculleus sp.]
MTFAVIRSPSIFEGIGDQAPSSSRAIVAVVLGAGKDMTASSARSAGVME